MVGAGETTAVAVLGVGDAKGVAVVGACDTDRSRVGEAKRSGGAMMLISFEAK